MSCKQKKKRHFKYKMKMYGKYVSSINIDILQNCWQSCVKVYFSNKKRKDSSIVHEQILLIEWEWAVGQNNVEKHRWL